MNAKISWTISRKLWLIAISAALGTLLLSAVFLYSERSLILEERQASVRQNVESAHSVLVHYQKLASTGAMPESDARRAALAAIKGMRYSGNEYFWINDAHPRMVMHPIRPELDGKDMSENKDPTGKRLFVEFVNTVKAAGAGFVFYMWPKSAGEEAVQKVSYVKGFEPWKWIIGSGVYIDTVETTFRQRALGMLAVVCVFAAALLMFCIMIARSITRPLNEAVGLAKKVAAGDLTADILVKTRDETGQLMQALKDMNDALATIVQGVRTGTDTIATASAQIATGNQDLSTRTEEQASSLQQTASSMEELTSTVRQNADNARQANHLAVTASDVAVRGGVVVSQVVETIEAINDSSKKMADIISVIDGIAFQTNILALNAAVEAARAGEQGRGFAVVATEVRSLAQRSATAAREIKSLIEDSIQKVEAGTRLVGRAGGTMDEVVASIGPVNEIMAEITAASHEQSEGIEQVNQAITQMDSVTQQNAALVEEAAAAAESLQGQAAGLLRAVSVFKLSGRRAA